MKNRPVSNRALIRTDYNAQAYYIVSYGPHNLKIELDMQMDDAGITKPSLGDGIITACTLPYELNAVNAPSSTNASLMHLREVRRQYHIRLKNLKREIRNLRIFLDRTSDLPSVDEHGFGIEFDTGYTPWRSTIKLFATCSIDFGLFLVVSVSQLGTS